MTERLRIRWVRQSARVDRALGHEAVLPADEGAAEVLLGNAELIEGTLTDAQRRAGATAYLRASEALRRGRPPEAWLAPASRRAAYGVMLIELFPDKREEIARAIGAKEIA